MKIFLGISLFVNTLLIAVIAFWALDYDGPRYGYLEKDVDVGLFADSTRIFTLPKGLVVKDVSLEGIGAAGNFEPYQFSIIVTSMNHSFINFNVETDSINHFGNYYSSEIEINRKNIIALDSLEE